MRWGWLVCASIAAGCGFTGPALQAAEDGGVDAALPPAVVNFASASSTQDEESGAVQVEVSLSRASTTPITVDYALVDHDGEGWATPGPDFTGGNGSITFAPGEMIKGIDLTILPDNEDEGAEKLEIALTTVTGDATLGDVKNHVVTISASILPRVSFMVASANGMESVSPVQLVLALNTMAASDVVVGYAVTGSASLMSGTFPDHDLAATGTATIPAGDTSVSIQVMITDDATDEDDEHLIVTLSSSTNAVVDQGKKVHDYTIVDDDLPPELTFDAASVMVSQDEADADVTLVAKLSARSEKEVSVEFAPNTTVANAATKDTDYKYMTMSPLTWTAGTTTLTKNIVVHVIEDTTDEPDEIVETGFFNPSNVTIPANTKSRLTIVDDDDPPLPVAKFAAVPGANVNVSESGGPGNNRVTTYTVELDKPATAAVTINITFSGTAKNGGMNSDFTYAGVPVTIPVGMMSKTFTVTVSTDQTDEDDETIISTLSNPTNATLDPVPANITRQITIIDNDP